ncbi:uncharacterized protein BYT42DRAFT_579425 [Radiomyces spectabilis]|uniref:uncharacterized protein n=1 Tax=Radiomyces spectabilis TaxID=64574 RepID=UPI00222114D5|nr:uncharacterized protein BYT42DRAFT_579425 [Radiomyces spectabilis]KAI8373165.1 hypothetical protein BYT42DRAFT_579425 [Radiomyces spectabilis]
MPKEKTKKTSRAMSPYNQYMKTELAKIKSENPGMEHKAAFKMAAKNWATAKENPKRKDAK